MKFIMKGKRMGELVKYPAKGLTTEAKASKNKYYVKVELRIDHELFQSEVFRLLSSTAMFVLLRFYQKRKWHVLGKGRKKIFSYDNTKIVFTYAEAASFDISQSQFHVTIKKLVELGLIDIEHQGGGYGRNYSRYNLSNRWKHYGTPLFKKVEKKRVLQAGLDVRSRLKKKEENTTKNRSYTTTENHSCLKASVSLG